MDSRQRVRAAMDHKPTDRVPMDLWGSACRIHTEEYKLIANNLGYENYGELLRPGSTTEYVDYRISDRVGADFRHINIGRPDGFQSYKDKDGNSYDEWGIGRKLISGYNAITVHPFHDADISAIKKHKWPVSNDAGRVRGLREQAKKYYEETNFAVTATSAVSGTIFEMAQYLRGTEDFLMDLYINQDFARALIDKVTEVVLDINLSYLEEIADYVEWIEFTEDLAMQRNLFISKDLFVNFFEQPHQTLFSEIKKRFPKLKIFFHSCGAISEMIPNIIGWGVDILNPLQPTADNMDLTFIKKEYGQDVIFHGGIDIQNTMIGTIAGIQSEVRERVDIMAEGGGYILAPTNHIQSDVPIENFFALYDYAKQYSSK